MRYLVLVVGLGLLLACGGGCNRTAPPSRPVAARPALPAAGEVVRVRVVPHASLVPGTLPDATLTEPGAIAHVIDWLRGLDWSAEPSDISRMDLPPLSQLTLEKRDGSVLEFGLVEHGIIYRGWLWPADIERLKGVLRLAGH